MNKDDILRMARETGLLWGVDDEYSPNWKELERFAALVATAEREACAKVCEARKIIEPDYEDQRHYNQGIEHCAAAIRARSDA